MEMNQLGHLLLAEEDEMQHCVSFEFWTTSYLPVSRHGSCNTPFYELKVQ